MKNMLKHSTKTSKINNNFLPEWEYQRGRVPSMDQCRKRKTQIGKSEPVGDLRQRGELTNKKGGGGCRSMMLYNTQSGVLGLLRLVFSDHSGVNISGLRGFCRLGLSSEVVSKFHEIKASLAMSGSKHTIWDPSLKIIKLIGKPHL